MRALAKRAAIVNKAWTRLIPVWNFAAAADSNLRL